MTRVLLPLSLQLDYHFPSNSFLCRFLSVQILSSVTLSNPIKTPSLSIWRLISLTRSIFYDLNLMWLWSCWVSSAKKKRCFRLNHQRLCRGFDPVGILLFSESKSWGAPVESEGGLIGVGWNTTTVWCWLFVVVKWSLFFRK